MGTSEELSEIILGRKPKSKKTAFRLTQMAEKPACEIWAGKGAYEKDTFHPGSFVKVIAPKQQGPRTELQRRTAPQQPPGSPQTSPPCSVPAGTERNSSVVPAL